MIHPLTKVKFINSFQELSLEIHQTAKDKGWWDSAEANNLREIADFGERLEVLEDSQIKQLRDMALKLERRNDGELLGLIHSEVSEALEAIRHNNPPDDKIPRFSGAEAELADVIIRIMDYALSRKWDVASAIIEKMEMNKTRSYKHGNKEF